jgi:hypothetical protein
VAAVAELTESAALRPGDVVVVDDFLAATPIKQGTPTSVNPEKPTQPQALADRNTTETKR